VLVNWKPTIGPIAPFLIFSGFGLAILMRQSFTSRTVALCLLAAGLGIWRFNSVQPQTTQADLATYNDKGTAEIVGVAIDAPDVRDKDIRLKLEVSQVARDGQTHQVRGLALVNADRYSGYGYGDKLRILGEPVTPPEFDTFSYRDYLTRSGIYTTIPFSVITLEAQGQGSPILAAMFDIRERSRQLISQLLPSPQSAL
jgi:competence protein ComEC